LVRKAPYSPDVSDPDGSIRHNGFFPAVTLLVS